MLHDKLWLEEQYLVKKRTYADIGKEIGATKYGVYHAMKRFNIKPRTHTSKYPQLNDKEWLRSKYVDELLSTKEIADIVGSTVGNVGSALVTMGIKLRTTKEGWHTKFKDGRYGEKSANWKGGITPLNRLIRSSKEYKAWRKAVFERDNYTCQHCHQHGGNLEADHIKQFAYYVELRLDPDNGRTLCVDCHRKTDTHSRKERQSEQED